MFVMKANDNAFVYSLAINRKNTTKNILKKKSNSQFKAKAQVIVYTDKNTYNKYLNVIFAYFSFDFILSL